MLAAARAAPRGRRPGRRDRGSRSACRSATAAVRAARSVSPRLHSVELSHADTSASSPCHRRRRARPTAPPMPSRTRRGDTATRHSARRSRAQAGRPATLRRTRPKVSIAPSQSPTACSASPSSPSKPGLSPVPIDAGSRQPGRHRHGQPAHCRDAQAAPWSPTAILGAGTPAPHRDGRLIPASSPPAHAERRRARRSAARRRPRTGLPTSVRPDGPHGRRLRPATRDSAGCRARMPDGLPRAPRAARHRRSARPPPAR